MNLLFVFLSNIDDQQRIKLTTLSPRGVMGTVWLLINEQVSAKEFDKKDILDKTGISTSHLDKITSELLAKCYQLIFGDDILALLHFLSSLVSLIKLFYNELNRQLKLLPNTGSVQQQAEFIMECFRMIHTNMPIVYREEKISSKLAKQYIALFTGAKKREAEFYMTCKRLFEELEMGFAATGFKAKAAKIEKEFVILGSPSPDFSEDVVFEYYWARTYLYLAQEDFAPALEVAQSALPVLRKYKSEKNEVYMLRMESKINELLYYSSRFDEAFSNYDKIINSPQLQLLPDRAYHTTKYIQLALITGHMKEATRLMEAKLAELGDRVEQLMIVRDIVSYVKYCLFKGDYETGFRFIQLGFEKNPKAKYFQYEIELRNLQTACFYLSGQEDVAIDVCQKHIKFLRNHGYSASTSEYPYFYVLTKAIFDKNTGGNFSARHQKMLDRYLQGSFAVYGHLLKKMMGS